MSRSGRDPVFSRPPDLLIEQRPVPDLEEQRAHATRCVRAGGGTRTRDRAFTRRLHCLCASPAESLDRDLNPGPPDYETGALPTEPSRQGSCARQDPAHDHRHLEGHEPQWHMKDHPGFLRQEISLALIAGDTATNKVLLSVTPAPRHRDDVVHRFCGSRQAVPADLVLLPDATEPTAAVPSPTAGRGLLLPCPTRSRKRRNRVGLVDPSKGWAVLLAGVTWTEVWTQPERHQRQFHDLVRVVARVPASIFRPPGSPLLMRVCTASG